MGVWAVVAVKGTVGLPLGAVVGLWLVKQPYARVGFWRCHSNARRAFSSNTKGDEVPASKRVSPFGNSALNSG